MANQPQTPLPVRLHTVQTYGPPPFATAPRQTHFPDSAMRSTALDDDTDVEMEGEVGRSLSYGTEVNFEPEQSRHSLYRHYDYRHQQQAAQYQYQAYSPQVQGDVVQSQRTARFERRITINDLILDTDVCNASQPSPTSTVYSSPLSSHTSTLAYNSPVFGVAQSFDAGGMGGKGSLGQNTLGLEFPTAGWSEDCAYSPATAHQRLPIASHIHHPSIVPTLSKPTPGPSQVGNGSQGHFSPQYTAQPKLKSRTNLNARSQPRASTSPGKKAASNPPAREKAQTAAKKAQAKKKTRRNLKATKGSRSEMERIQVMKDDIFIIQFGVVHAVCGGCSQRLAIDGRSRFYPGMLVKHANTCAAVRAKRIDMAQRRQRGEVILNPPRTWIFMNDEEETYVLADENGNPRPIIPPKEKKGKNKAEAELPEVIDEVEEEQLEYEQDEFGFEHEDDAEYFPSRSLRFS